MELYLTRHFRKVAQFCGKGPGQGHARELHMGHPPGAVGAVFILHPADGDRLPGIKGSVQPAGKSFTPSCTVAFIVKSNQGQ